MSTAAAGSAWASTMDRTRRSPPRTASGVQAKDRRRDQWRRGQIVLGAFVALGLAITLVWVRLQVVHTGYDLSAARRLEHTLEQEQRELQLEIATRTSPRRLEEAARTRLGMGPPEPGQVVRER